VVPVELALAMIRLQSGGFWLGAGLWSRQPGAASCFSYSSGRCIDPCPVRSTPSSAGEHHPQR